MPAHAQTSTAAIVAAGRRLLEQHGPAALTMRDIAQAVGVRAPSLYKRVRNREHLLQLILEDVADELTVALEAAASSGDPAQDLRSMAQAYREYAHTHPRANGLLYAPNTAPGATARAQRSSAALLRLTEALAGPDNALHAARTVVAWAHGFIAMELAGAFRLGDDIDAAWHFGIARLIGALRETDRPGT
jgi:AcrR family transcriptional regulator